MPVICESGLRFFDYVWGLEWFITQKFNLWGAILYDSHANGLGF